ncbi:Fc receptor-like protein 3 [Brachyhypopomus gauderio]|uniref:Fc receptor-like protein 3 n=1 Tax=Brachyhypopomus gauderio TaxID=698409 RepID=UPI0040423A8D
MAFLLLVVLGVCQMGVSVGAQKLAKPVIMGPAAGLLNNITEFYCWVGENPQNWSLLYQLYRQDNFNKTLGDSTATENATFPAFLNFKYNGRLVCKASVHNNSEIEPSYSNWLDFRVIDPVVGAFLVSTPAPGDLWEGESLTLQCHITKGNYVSYSWLLNDIELMPSTTQSHLNISSLSTHDSGRYVCIASNQISDTFVFSNRSNVIDVQVKEYVSKPGILFDVFIDANTNLTINVTCSLAKGTPPINFTLLIGGQINDTKLGGNLIASFLIPVLPDQDRGLAQCQASNGGRVMKSKKLNLTVESVGGAVTMRLQKAEESFMVVAVSLYCSVERGTFPHFSWFRNNSRLKDKGPDHSVFGEHSSGLSLWSLGPWSAGYYHCEAGNKFNNATRLHSQKTLITKQGLNRVPTVVVAIVFTCFSLLIITVTACCLYGVLRRRRAGIYKLKQYLSERSNIVDEDEEDKHEYENEYENEEGIYDEEDDVGVVGEYREDTDTEQPSLSGDSDEGEDEDEANKDLNAM